MARSYGSVIDALGEGHGEPSEEQIADLQRGLLSTDDDAERTSQFAVAGKRAALSAVAGLAVIAGVVALATGHATTGVTSSATQDLASGQGQGQAHSFTDDSIESFSVLTSPEGSGLGPVLHASSSVGATEASPYSNEHTRIEEDEDEDDVDGWSSGKKRKKMHKKNKKTEHTGELADSPQFGGRREGYAELSKHTLKMYGIWDMILEPNAEMIFEISNYNASNKYVWNFTVTPSTDIPTYDDTDGHDFQVMAQGSGTIEVITTEVDHAVAKFAKTNIYYRCAVTMYSDENPHGITTTKDGVTKHVRREIRSLTDGHRNKYFDAMSKVYSLTQEEGQALYGQHFVSHAHLTAMHDSSDYVFHGNLAFLTSHPAMQIKLEKSLSSIHADLVFPYWDFMIDSKLGKNWSQSEIYSETWFGTTDNYEADDFRVRGKWFRDSEKSFDDGEKLFPMAQHSPYGFVTSSMDFNKQPYLQRTNKVCNFAATEGYAKCDSISHCFGNYSTLYDFDICLEADVHANLHSMHAGLFDCEVDWNDWYGNHSWITEDRLSFFANQIAKIQSTAMLSLYDDYVYCDTSCDLKNDTYATCRCSVIDPEWATPASMAASLTAMELRELLQPWYWYAYEEGLEAKMYIEVDSTLPLGPNQTSPSTNFYKPIGGDKDSINRMDEGQVYELELLLFQTIIFSGNQGVMAYGASSEDPLFWVMHQMFDKALQAARLSPVYNQNNFTWNNAVLGSGDRWMASTSAEIGEGIAPTTFTGEIFEWFLGGRKDVTAALTNKELWALLKPDSNSLGYVYDQFTSWGECEFDPME